MKNEIRVYKSRKKGGYFIVFAFLLICIGIFLLQRDDKEVTGWSCIILGIIMLFWGVYSLLTRSVQIVINEKGIASNDHQMEIIEWDAIKRADEFYFRGQFYIRLILNQNYKPNLNIPHWYPRIDDIYKSAGIKALYLKIRYLNINSATLLHLINSMVNSDEPTRQQLIQKYSDKFNLKRNMS